MKKVILFFCAALLALGANASDYEYEPKAKGGDWAIGLNINQGTPNPVFNVGVGGKVQFYASRAFRLEADFNAFFKRKGVNYWDTNLNAHYVIYMKKRFSLFPILGASLQYGRYLDHGLAFGGNAGVGLQYDITNNLYTTLESYYKFGSKSSLDTTWNEYQLGHSRVNFSLGIAFRF